MTTVRRLLEYGLREKRKATRQCVFEMILMMIFGVMALGLVSRMAEEIFIKIVLILVILIICSVLLLVGTRRCVRENGWECSLEQILKYWYAYKPDCYEMEENYHFAMTCVCYCLNENRRNSEAFQSYWFEPINLLDINYDFSFWFGGEPNGRLRIGIYDSDGSFQKELSIPNVCDFESLIMAVGEKIINNV